MAFGLTFDNVIGHVNIAEGSNEVPVRSFNFNREVASVTMPDSGPTIGHGAFCAHDPNGVSSSHQFKEALPTSANESDVELIFTELDPDPYGTSGELTEEGWASSDNSGIWSDNRDAASEFNDVDGFSLFIQKGVKVNTLGGNDKLVAYNEVGSGLEVNGNLSMGDGRDLIDIRVTNSLIGIENSGKIDLGAGNDSIVSITRKVPGGDTDALINHKSINMGKGDDLIDASAGGLGGNGKIKMGKGDDEFAGFGDMRLVDGGKGLDKLRLDLGVYSVMIKGDKYRVAKGRGSADFRSFELIGSKWSRDDDFVDFEFNKSQFAMVVDEHGVTFI